MGERLGRGGMAEVYRARQVSLDRDVAIKLLHPFLADDPEFMTRFENEAKNIARLSHENIVRVIDFDRDVENETYYMVMELINGPTLKEYLLELEAQGKRLSVRDAVRIVREAASALAYAHSQNMIHRDVKPANLMIDRDSGRVVLTDFGIAKIVKGGQFTASGGMVGTPAYMSPEQGIGEAGDERSDLYSLGVILFQLLTGRLPFDGEQPIAIILSHMHEPIPAVRQFNEHVPEALETVVRRLMAKSPLDRYQTAQALITDLDAVVAGTPLSDLAFVARSVPARGSTDTQIVDVDGAVAAERLLQEEDEVDTQQRNKPVTTQPLPVVPAPATSARGGRGLLLGILALLIVGGGALVVAGSSGTGPLAALLAPTATLTPSPTLTLTPTQVTPTETFTPTPSETPTATPTETLTPSVTPTPTDTDTPTPTSTATPSDTPTYTPTATDTSTFTPTFTASYTPTSTSTATLTPTVTATPTATLTPSITPSPTINVTLTLLQSTLFFEMQTATVAACDYDYRIIEQVPADSEFFPANQAYARSITLLNTGNCPWDRNASLVFVSGDSFNVTPPYVFIRQRVGVGEEVTITISGRAPSRSGIQSGVWELRTAGQLPIGDPITLSINVYQGG